MGDSSSDPSTLAEAFLPMALTTLKIGGALVVAALVLLYANQEKLLYHPAPPGFPKTPKENPEYHRSPAEWTVVGAPKRRGSTHDSIPFEEMMLTTSDGAKIHIWLFLQPNSSDTPTLIYFHGNAGNMGFRLKNAAEMYATCGINVLMMDYRGYGLSEGTPTERGLKIDADSVLQWASKHPKLGNSPLVVFGRSLGGAVAIETARRFPDLVKGIVAENTFLSISAMVDVLMPWVSSLKGLVLSIGWRSDAAIASLKQPMLFISGDSDELVPPVHMKQLFELATASEHKDFFSVLGGHHNDTWEMAGKRYYERLKAFMDIVRSKYCTASSGENAKVDLPTDSSEGVHHALPTMGRSFGVH